MFIIGLLFYPALLWIILYFVLGENSVPPFRSLFLTLFIVNIIALIFQSLLGIFSLVPNFLLFTGLLTMIFKLDFKQTLIAVGIFECIILLFQLIIF